MSLKDLELKISYSSESDDILDNFYIPALSQSKHYYRLAGFFSSSSLAVAAKGISNLIKNEGDMKLICSARLNEDDVNEIKKNKDNYGEIIENTLLRDLKSFENLLIRDHVKALGWLYSKGRLAIKVAIMIDDENIPLDYYRIVKLGLFHLKVGILEDSEGNLVSFSGSINETRLGWLENIEEFKVFRSWNYAENKYLEKDFTKFKKFWEDSSIAKSLHSRIRIFDLPTAIQNELIQIAPKNFSDLQLRKLKKPLVIVKPKKQKINLRDYQKKALNAWLENNKKGIFEMATGTGKTITALGCLNKIHENVEDCISIISCPQTHLVNQWEEEIKKLNIYFDTLLIASGSNYKWKDSLSDLLDNNYLGYDKRVIIITTHDTFSSADFRKLIKTKAKSKNLFLIADEVHGLGSGKRREGLTSNFRFRLGLSATPRRWYDSIGTEYLYNYFGNVVYEFPLSKALMEINPDTGKTFLTPYRYLPSFAYLNEFELEEYLNLTRKIVAIYSKSKVDYEVEEKLERLLFCRADILKNAENKFELLENLLDELGKDIKWTIIYTSPKQIDEVIKLVNRLKIRAHRFTMSEGVKPSKKYNGMSERRYILEKFANGKYQVLIAMKCLDEGVDIPPARVAIIMSSSGNPREYIQRIGRVVRRYENKKEAKIYDLIVAPSKKRLPEDLKDIEVKIFEKEFERFLEIAQTAINSVSAVQLINKHNY
ncbi:MAG: DEAD/DEAH box helicase family protein [Actinomycetia bacterium]|nr:DEAD/DEAH box helicase family protein [Actinomycetes bacterium]